MFYKKSIYICQHLKSTRSYIDMENNNLKIVWLKQCVKDFENLSEEEFIKVDLKLRKIISQLYQNTSRVEGTDLRRLRIGRKRLFLRIVRNKVYCIGYKPRDKAYNKKQLKEMNKIIKKIISEQGL